MLRRLHVRDYVIVAELELEFGSGFGVLTGETGAGKSILVDALALVLGERADPGVVRPGCERADISAEFDVADEAAEWLLANDFGAEMCLARRVVEANGRSRAYINGVPTAAAQLKALGDLLVDIHGQHAHHALLRCDAQRALVDAYAGLSGLAQEVATNYREWSKLREALRDAEANNAASERERELLGWQIAELRRLAFDPGQWEALIQEQRRLAHVAALVEGASQTVLTLDEGDGAACLLVAQGASRVAALAEYDPALREVGDVLESVENELREAVRALKHYRDRLEAEPHRLVELEQRIAAVTELARKHRVPPESLPHVEQALARRLDELQAKADPRLLAERTEAAREVYRSRARRLSEGRVRGAIDLSTHVSAAMQELAMAGGRFEVALTAVAEGAAYGMESVEFLVSTAVGQPLRPLAKVASGGELSRIGLAIQVITSQSGRTPTLVFDEVDVGIGGAVAEIVGKMLKTIGSQRQVLCVTHLPQVAAQGDWQWSVTKESAGKSVVSRVTPLDHQGRIDEIARMLGGVTVTATTRRHAREMLGF